MKKRKKTWIITGGANGIGRYMVIDLCKNHEKVIFLDHDEDGANQTLSECLNKDVSFIACDLNDVHSMDQAIKSILMQTDQIDVMIHNAGINKGGLLNAHYDDFISTLKVNVGAPYYITKQLMPILGKKASIVLIGSTRAIQSQKNTESYSASKGALISLSHAMSMTLSGVARVNVISPGWIDSKASYNEKSQQSKEDHFQHPSKRIGIPMDIMKAVYYLTDDSNDFVNASHIVIDGGMSKQMIYHNDEGWTFRI